MQRTVIVGDIHGCYDELMSLLKKINLSDDDRVIAVGDLITKGPRNRQVLDLFATDNRLSSVIGNQDLAILSFWRGEDITLTEAQERTIQELEFNGAYYQKYLATLPLYQELDSHIVVHAGVRPGIPLEKQSVEDLTELRTLGADRTERVGVPWFEVYEGDKVVLFGHWPGPEPKLAKRAIGLDTGCVYGHRLTAFILETNEFVSVPAQRINSLPFQCS